ncbi:cupin domain-containing protein [Campylobacter jejuni]|uniref:cupin domain-containing protein n=1 Tax=Campylobacter jejuni TaxID=197 RepID=UPI003BA71C01
MNKISVAHLGDDFLNQTRIELKEKLDLTGCEVSFNKLQANTCVPFIHHHKQNEELFIILEGQGELVLDGEKILVNKGDVIRVKPEVKRQFFAKSVLNFICVQVKEHSLGMFS